MTRLSSSAVAATLGLLLLSGCPPLVRYPAADGGQAGAGGASCVDTQLCIRGDHWDSSQCACVSDAEPTAGAGDAADGGTVCIQNQACVRDSHWDRQQCACVPDAASSGGGAGGDADAGAADGCSSAQDCRGVLPHICALCSARDAGAGTGGSACAHWACKQGQCSVALCE